MLEIWCQKVGAAFCGGAGIGAGAAAVTLRKVPWDGPEKMPVQQALEKVAHLILEGGRHPPYYTGFQISRKLIRPLMRKDGVLVSVCRVFRRSIYQIGQNRSKS